MTLRLTPKQYRTLIKMAWISSRVAYGSELQDSEAVESIMELTDHLCTMAPEFGAEDMFERVDAEDPDPEFAVGTPPPLTVRLKPDLENELMAIIEWYEEYSFWDLLEDRMAMRDISEERTEAQWEWLPEAEKDRIYDKYVDFYFEEFSDYGLGNLRVVPPEPGKPVVPLGWGDNTPVAPAAPADNGKRPGKIIQFPGGSGSKGSGTESEVGSDTPAGPKKPGKPGRNDGPGGSGGGKPPRKPRG